MAQALAEEGGRVMRLWNATDQGGLEAMEERGEERNEDMELRRQGGRGCPPLFSKRFVVGLPCSYLRRWRIAIPQVEGV